MLKSTGLESDKIILTKNKKMAKCECLEKCDFFNDKMANMPSMAHIIKMKYCESDNSECARYVVYKVLGKEGVPSNMFPTQMDRARELI